MPRRTLTSQRRTGATTASSPEGVATALPEVILDVVFEDGLFFLSVRNIGGVPAHAVSVRFENRILGLEDREITALPLFRGIEFLAPGREIRTFLDTSASYFARRQPTRVTARIAYKDAGGRRYTRTIRHDLEIYRDIGYVRKTAE
ncbi:MAG: hypothetical protein ACT4P5_03325 [Armatimonadota bacterium]